MMKEFKIENDYASLRNRCIIYAHTNKSDDNDFAKNNTDPLSLAIIVANLVKTNPNISKPGYQKTKILFTGFISEIEYIYDICGKVQEALSPISDLCDVYMEFDDFPSYTNALAKATALNPDTKIPVEGSPLQYPEPIDSDIIMIDCHKKVKYDYFYSFRFIESARKWAREQKRNVTLILSSLNISNLFEKMYNRTEIANKEEAIDCINAYYDIKQTGPFSTAAAEYTIFTDGQKTFVASMGDMLGRKIESLGEPNPYTIYNGNLPAAHTYP